VDIVRETESLPETGRPSGTVLLLLSWGRRRTGWSMWSMLHVRAVEGSCLGLNLKIRLEFALPSSHCGKPVSISTYFNAIVNRSTHVSNGLCYTTVGTESDAVSPMQHHIFG